jgi:hypothetical protein
MLENPFTRNNVDPWRARNKLSSGVLLESTELLHSSAPIWIGEGAAIGLRDRGKWSSMKNRSGGHPKPALCMSAHGVVIDHCCPQSSSLRQGWGRRGLQQGCKARRNTRGTPGVDSLNVPYRGHPVGAGGRGRQQESNRRGPRMAAWS